MNPWKQWCIAFAGMAIGLLGCIFLFNVIVDPYNISMLVTLNHMNVKEPTVIYQSRLIKAVGIVRYKPDTIITGSSIVDSGFNIPGSAAHYEPWRAGHDLSHSDMPIVYNAGVRDGAIDDMFEMLKHAYANNPHLKKVIVGIEWSQVTDLKTVGHMTDTPLLGHTSLFPYAYQKYLTWTALDDAVRTVQDNLKVTQTGISLTPFIDGFIHGILHLVGDASAADSLTVTPVASQLYGVLPVLTKNAIETRMFHFSAWFAVGFARSLRNGSPSNLHRPDAIAVIRNMINFAKEKHITLIFYASPQPPLFWALVRKSGTWPYYADWLRLFAGMTNFYDFSTLSEIYEKPEVYFADDSLHFSLPLGEKLLPVLLADKCSEETACVTRETVEKDISLRERQLDDWGRDHPYEETIVNGFHSNEKEDLISLLPTSYEPTVRGFHIIRLLSNQYFAIPESQPAPYDMLRVLNHDYPSMLAADSLDGIISKIQQTK